MYQQVIVTAGIPQSTPSLVVVHTHPLWGHCGNHEGPFDQNDYSVHLQPVLSREEFENAVEEVNVAARNVMGGGCRGPQTPKALVGFLIFLGLLIGGISMEASESTFHFPVLIVIAVFYLFIYFVVMGIWYRRLVAQMFASVGIVLEELNTQFADRNIRFALREYQDPHHHHDHHHHHHNNNQNNLKHMYLEIEIGQQQAGFYPQPVIQQQVPYSYPPQGTVVQQYPPQQPQYVQTVVHQQQPQYAQAPVPQQQPFVAQQSYDPNQQYALQQQPQYAPQQPQPQYVPQQQYDPQSQQQYAPQQQQQQQQQQPQFAPQFAIPPPPHHQQQQSTPTPHPDQPVLIAPPPKKSDNPPPSDNNDSLL